MNTALIKFTIPLFTLIFFLSTSSSFAQIPTRVPTKAQAGQLNACQARERAVKKQMSQLLRMATNMMEVFDRISNKVQDYYNDTVLPSGTLVPNYTTLVNNIVTEKSQVQDALNLAQRDINNLSCDNNTQRVFALFRTHMQTVKNELKQYRAAINDLIVAVHSTTPTVTP